MANGLTEGIPSQANKTPAQETPSGAGKDSAHENSSEVSFEDLMLRHGAAIQIESLADEVNHYAKFIGALKSSSILVSTPVVNGEKIRVQAGQPYVIRGFTGKHVYAFESRVIMAHDHPFAYIHFAYPHSVNSRAVRKSMRVKLNLPATANPVISGKPLPVTIIDLSITGAMINSAQPIGGVGDAIKLVFPVAFEKITASMNISAKIRSSVLNPYAEKTLQYGLEFEDIPHNDDLILRCFIYAIETGEEKPGRETRADKSKPV